MKLTKRQKRDLKSIAAAIVLLLCAILAEHLILPKFSLSPLLSGIINRAIYLPAYIMVGRKTLSSAFSNILRGQVFDENFLMSIASLSAIALGESLEGVAVMLFSAVGNLFESYAVNNARGAVETLAKLCPDEVNVLREGEVLTVPAEDVAVGEIFIVGAGERIALDGTVIEGSAALDCSSMTGESLPVDVSAGSPVLSGTINRDGMLKIRADKPASQSGAARTVAMVEEAAVKKSKTEAFITKFALWYTPLVVGVALVFGVAGSLIDPTHWHTWVYRALSFLVVSCPCALVISVPLCFFGSVGGAAKRGILFKDNSKLETLSRIRAAAFDKTGTLTIGKPAIHDIYLSDCDEDTLLKIAAGCEYSSTHPLALAILEKAGDRFDPASLSDLAEIAGKGRTAKVDGKFSAAGNQKLMDDLGISIPHDCPIPGTAVYVACEGKFLGAIGFADQIKPESFEAISLLKSLNVNPVMLSGDSPAGAKAVADELSIDDWRASLLPADKLAALEGLISEGTTAFIGDGINDSPSLARADIGFAMGSAGSDAAIEAADVVLVGDNPRKVYEAIKISRKTMSVAKQNIIFALAVKILVMLLCAFGLVNMWVAVFGDVGVSVIAILNSMRTLEK